MLISEIGPAPMTQSAWKATGVRGTDEMRRPARELLMLPGITGGILYEGVSLREIGTAHNLSAERAGQRLHLQFGLTGELLAAVENAAKPA
jgi:hypothetical protein